MPTKSVFLPKHTAHGKKKYVSERIVNIRELKDIIEKSRLDTLGILEECRKKEPSIKDIEGYAKQLEIRLYMAENFDFLIERATTVDKS